jgi:hypothetical protein
VAHKKERKEIKGLESGKNALIIKINPKGTIYLIKEQLL